MDFSSDNASGIAPEILAAIGAANAGTASSYGNDDWTERLQKAMSDLFERDVAVFPVFTGTAANSIALASATAPWGAIFCHSESHIHVDECGAPEFYSGAKLLPLEGAGGKIEGATLPDKTKEYFGRGVHSAEPMSISITEASEFGTVYTPDEISDISEFAKRRKLALHMDGARFANAVATLGCSPAALSWKAGVDVMSFGATKNGALAAEAIVVFTPELKNDLEFRRKRGGHLSSKMRFVSAQLLAYLENGLWLELAKRANASARRLADGMTTLGFRPAFPVEANEVFVRLPVAMVDALQKKGARFFPWTQSPDKDSWLIRLVASFATPEKDIVDFIAAVKSLSGK